MVERESKSTAFSLGKGARTGNISVGGHVAGRDVVVTNTTAAGATSAPDMSQVLAALQQVEDELAKLDEAPAGLREDVQDELRKAHQAGTQGDSERLTEKLSSAQSYLERIGENLPAAVTLAQTVATLALRVSGQG
jgi:hypothetical protein